MSFLVRFHLSFCLTAFVALLALPLSVGDAVAASRQAQEKAARKACLSGDYAAGVAILSDLFVETGAMNLIFNQGRCFEQNRRYEDAIARFQEYLRAGRDKLRDSDKAEAEKHIADCKQMLAQERELAPAKITPEPSFIPPPAPPPQKTETPTEPVETVAKPAAEADSASDGAGACSTPGASACPGSLCATDGTAKCATMCTASSCGASAYCDPTGACLPTLDNGTGCSTGAQCTSGFCVDGLCCDGKCDGQCESCKETGSLGKCKVLTGAPLSTRTACGGAGTCKGQCDGTNGQACVFPDSAKVCTAGTCTAGKATSASVCNGSGACTTATTTPCTSNLCGTDGKCSDSCTATSCSAGNYCDSTGTCSKTLDLGANCSSATQCTSGLCVDGVCCDGKCDGQCQSCKATGSVGKCKTIQGDPVSPRAACGGTGKCKASCDGTNATSCTFPDSETVCTPASCAAGKLTTASVCNGSGSCTAASTNPCPNQCASDGSAKCADLCTATSCGAGLYCNSGVCTPTIADGKPCSTGTQCTNGNCISGICCATACGTCYSCATGICTASLPGTSCGTGVCNASHTCVACTEGASCTGPANDPCHKYAISCSAGAVCVQSGNQPNTLACGNAPSCVNSVQYDQAYCSGGTCPAQNATPCASGCSGTKCLTCSVGTVACGGSCCNTTSNYCNGTVCTPKPGAGQPCSASVPCASGYTCSNGYCCGSGLTGCGLNQCVNLLTSTSNCGACGKVCDGCISGNCCKLSWNFADSSIGSWYILSGNGVLTTQGQAMIVQNAAFTDTSSSLSVKTEICGGAYYPTISKITVDLRFYNPNGLAFGDDGTGSGSVTILVEGTGFNSTTYLMQGVAPLTSGMTYSNRSVTPSVKTTGCQSISFRFFPSNNWTGTIFFDNIIITP